MSLSNELSMSQGNEFSVWTEKLQRSWQYLSGRVNSKVLSQSIELFEDYKMK